MKTSINLFPEKNSRQNGLRKTIRFWSIAFALLLAILVFHAESLDDRVSASSSWLHFVQRQEEPGKFMRRKTESLGRELEAFEQETAREQEQRRPIKVLLAKIMTGVQADRQKLSITKIDLGNNRPGTARIEGVATSSRVVEQLLERLIEENLFLTVRIGSESEYQIDGIGVRKYTIDCTF